MKKLASIDLYTGLILVCVVLLPVCGWWCMKTNEEISLCEKAVRDATRSGGLLEQIGALQKKIEIVNNNRGGTNPMNAREYFDRQIMAAAAQGGLKDTDFGLDGPKQEPARITGSRQKATDHVVEVEWKNKDLALKLDFVESLLWNCESGAGIGGGTNVQSIWKLQQLTIVNLTDEKTLQRYDTPPPELEDRWAIRQMKFARREPSK